MLRFYRMLPKIVEQFFTLRPPLEEPSERVLPPVSPIENQVRNEAPENWQP